MTFQGHDYGVASNVWNTTSPKQQFLFEDAKHSGENMTSSGTELQEASCGFGMCFLVQHLDVQAVTTLV